MWEKENGCCVAVYWSQLEVNNFLSVLHQVEIASAITMHLFLPKSSGLCVEQVDCCTKHINMNIGKMKKDKEKWY